MEDELKLREHLKLTVIGITEEQVDKCVGVYKKLRKAIPSITPSDFVKAFQMRSYSHDNIN